MKKPLFTLFLLSAAIFSFGQYPLVPIDSVQYMSPARLAQVKFNVTGQDSTLPDYIRPVYHNPQYGDTVVIEGIVTFDPSSYGLSTSRGRRSAFLQEASGRPWSGVEVMLDTSVLNPRPTQAALEAASQFTQNMKKGRKVRVTCIIRHFQGHTQLNVLPIPTQVISLGNTITPAVINAEDLMKNVQGSPEPQFETGEQWEGVYVELRNVTVSDVSPSGQRWFWSVKDANGNTVSIRDYSNYYRNDNNDDDPNTPRNFIPPTNGSFLPYLRGVVTESGNLGSKQYFIAPLYPDDMASSTFQPPKVSDIKRNPVIVTPSNTVTISATIIDDSTVASATLYYAVGYNNATFTPVTMAASGSTYSATIPAQAVGSIVKYYIRATDNGGNSINSPDSLALSSAYKVVSGITSIRDIQETPYAHGGSMYVNDTLKNITVPGIVVSTFAPNDLGLFVLQDGSNPWSAIFVRPTVGDGVTSWRRGDSIVITEAIVTERISLSSDPFGRTAASFGTTFLENVKFTVAGTCKAMPAPVQSVPLDSMLSPTFSKEPFETMMIRYNNVYVVNQNPDAPSNFGEFAVHTDSGSGNGFRGENFSSDLGFTFNTDSIALKEKLSVFQGPLVFAFGNWKLFPRNRTDVGKAGDLIEPYINLIGLDTVYHPRGTTYNDAGATACDDMDGDISSSINVSGSVNDTVNGTYVLLFNVSDNAGNPASTVTRTVIVQSGAGISQPAIADMKLYPVPAGDVLNIAISNAIADEATVTIMDVTGKTILTKAVNIAGNNTVTAISTAELSTGVYFCRLSNGSFSTVQKFTVVK